MTGRRLARFPAFRAGVAQDDDVGSTLSQGSTTGVLSGPNWSYWPSRVLGSADPTTIAHRHGTHRITSPDETWLALQPFLAPAGITGVADVTWLDCLGIPTVQAVRPASLTLSVSQGKAASYRAAQVSAVMESLEEPLRPGPPPTVWSRRWRQRWAPPTSVAASADHGESFVDVTDLEVLSFLSVSSVDYWAYRPALQQVAAWYWTLKHPEQSGSVGERAARAVAEVASEGYGRALEFIAYRYALATGIIDETGFPEAVAAHWLTTEERHGLGNDPISISARVITRTLFVVRLLPAIDHFLDLLRKDSRLPRWRAMAAHALCKRDDLARQKPHLNLGRPDPTQLKRLFGARWGTQVNRIELARRGLMTEDAFYAAATPFAVAAVDDQLPRIEVGTLGPAPLSADVPERHFDFGSV